MRPAFSSPRQATAFLALLLLVLSAPALIGKKWLPPLNQGYASGGWNWGPYPWITKEIFEETNDIDILFIGSSHLLWGIDTPYVQEQLDQKLGRPTVVRSICWGGAGFDGAYFIGRDLLAHRRVKLLVFQDESLDTGVNPKTPHWFRYADEAADLDGLHLRERSIYYFAAMVGMATHLGELAAPNLRENTNGPGFFETRFHADNPETRLGSVRGRVGYAPNLSLDHPFAPFLPHTGATPDEAVVFSRETASKFQFDDQALPDWQLFFARKFAKLAQHDGCRLVLLHMPVETESRTPAIREADYWPTLLGAPIVMVGIPGRQLFAGLQENQVRQLYGDWGHLNQNGQQYFTPLVTPRLLQLYENWPPQ